MATEADKHSLFSSVREEYVEYAFLAQLCSFSWKADRFVEIARSNTDAFGYDVIVTCEGISRHIQLKAMKEGGRASFQKVNTNLASAPSGCVIWLVIDDESLQPTKYGWFGAKPKSPLPSLGKDVAKHSKGDANGEKKERYAIRKVKKREFEWLNSISEVFERLFGQGNDR